MPFKTSLRPPPGLSLTCPTRSTPQPQTNPPVLNHALTVRAKVFVDEQHCSAENEVDDDDARSWHWVVYDMPSHGDERIGEKGQDESGAIGVVRLVPPPHVHAHGDENTDGTPTVDDAEPYIKLTRVAVLPEYRGRGIGRLLVATALDWARGHAREIMGRDGDAIWTGLVLVHAQVSVEGMYRRMGFVTDERMGRWQEEGIEHVGMWRRVDLVQSTT